MRQNWTKIVCAVSVFITMTMLSCSYGHMDDVSGSSVEVGIYAGGGSETRTEMLSNGLSAVWEDGDELAVWAKDENGSYELDNQLFLAYGLDGGHGFFTSVIPEPMPDGEYTYYCCYPKPLSIKGTNVTFDIPALQDGTASDGLDIMIADPVRHGALMPIPSENDDNSHLSMRMNRMMHHLRFYVPGDNAVLGDDKIVRLSFEFPDAVAGKVTYDFADPSYQSELSDSKSKIDLFLDKPISVSTGQTPDYAYLVMAPTAFAEGQMLKVTAYTEDRMVEIDPINLCAKNFEAGHSTPVRLNVRQIKDFPYSMTFKVTASNLGEDLDFISIPAPEGCSWDDKGTTELIYKPATGKIRVNDQFVIKFADKQKYRAFSGETLNVTFDSEHAITGQTVTLPDLSANDKVTVNLAVPYLLKQDFSGISSYSDGHDSPKTGFSSDTWVGIQEMTSCGMSGWHGVRAGVKDKTALRICCRYQNVLGGKAYYKGQLYAPSIATIKDGKFVNVSVSFRYGGYSSKTKDAKPLMYFGINTLNPLVNPDDADLISGVINGGGYGNQKPVTLSPLLVDGQQLGTSGEYTFEGTKTVIIEGIDNFMRMAWIVSTTHSASNTNSNTWLYLDDITVQIANN